MNKVSKRVIITEVDLKKIVKKSGLSMRRLAREAGIDYIHFTRVVKDGKGISDNYWNAIKKVLDK